MLWRNDDTLRNQRVDGGQNAMTDQISRRKLGQSLGTVAGAAALPGRLSLCGAKAEQHANAQSEIASTPRKYLRDFCGGRRR